MQSLKISILCIFFYIKISSNVKKQTEIECEFFDFKKLKKLKTMEKCL